MVSPGLSFPISLRTAALDCQIQAILAGFGNPARAIERIILPD
jgi:hypothetical protein